MKSSVVILVPIYRSSFTEDEMLSLHRLQAICANLPIRFVAPESLTFDSHNIPVERFDDMFFQGIEGYNRLMLSATFYQRFEQYDYLLIHQLDAFLFRNEIEEWCNRGFDYIGAPWLVKRKYKNPLGKVVLWLRSLPHRLRHVPFLPIDYADKVGNGGLSLRRVHACLDVCLNHEKEIRKWLSLSQQHKEYNEDCFWATRPHWHYPSVDEALAFSIDLAPKEALKRLGGIPMGCHGWSKPNYKPFWMPFITPAIATSQLPPMITPENTAAVVVLFRPTEQQRNNYRHYQSAVAKVYTIDNTNNNIGIAAALNEGFRMALQDGYQWVLTMDQDSILETEQLHTLMNEANNYPEREKVGIFSVRQVYGDKNKPRPRYEERFSVMCSGNLVSADAIRKTHGMRAELFIDCVDDDFCLRVQREGYKVVMANEVRMEHHLGLGYQYTRLFHHKYMNHPAFRQYYMMRNILVMIRDYPEQRPYYRRQLRKRIKHVLLYDSHDKWEKMKAMWQGWHDFRHHIMGPRPQ